MTSHAATAPKQNAAWAELIQLVPVISLALPFILRGSVDLGQAASGFLIAALLTIPITAAVVMRKELLNPILIGTALWLWAGALAFNLPIDPLARWLTHTQAFGLFAAAFGAGLVATFASPYGYAACRCSDPAWLKRTSFALLAWTFVTVIWAWAMRANIRLGGGLPFIVLNVARRAACLRAPR